MSDYVIGFFAGTLFGMAVLFGVMKDIREIKYVVIKEHQIERTE